MVKPMQINNLGWISPCANSYSTKVKPHSSGLGYPLLHLCQDSPFFGSSCEPWSCKHCLNKCIFLRCKFPGPKKMLILIEVAEPVKIPTLFSAWDSGVWAMVYLEATDWMKHVLSSNITHEMWATFKAFLCFNNIWSELAYSSLLICGYSSF